MATKLLRSLLFVPGNRANMLDKAMGFAPDAFVPDLEDSVADGDKGSARRLVTSYLPKLDGHGPVVIPRVNALPSGLIEADLAAVIGPHTYAVSVGKIDTPADIDAITTIMSALERLAGVPVGAIHLIPWIETARAIVHCFDICRASERIIGVAFGAEDFTNDMAIERSDDDADLGYARSAVCIAARAAGVAALDTPYFQFKNEPGLRTNAQAAKRVGFKGKFAIHPAQVEPINQAFSPSADEIAQAQRVVEAFEQAERAGRGSTSLDGKVIDVPVVKRARALLEFAARAGARV